ncbi:MAG: DUF5060 domain-containing protein [Bryobacter sp.]|nr:DUF5060 domain-containing protein [Bryobacter sp.]
MILLLAICAYGAEVSGELKQWHKVTLSWSGPQASETGTPNPFLDYRLEVTFTHESGGAPIVVPGYFAADGKAGETSATEGNQWRAHFAPPKAGKWNYAVRFVSGAGVAVTQGAGKVVSGVDGDKGSFSVVVSDKQGRDFRAHGRLSYVGGHYLQFAGSKEYFLKAGVDSPETLLAYADFDGTTTRKVPLKTYEPHLKDWQAGNPLWQSGKGKGLIGALNYLAAKGLNSISFLTYNAGGDGDNVWPHLSPDEKLRMDTSKLDQWQIVFDHAQALGLYLHFKLQEQENDDERIGHEAKPGKVPAALDGGKLGPERKLYLRELIARYGYLLALNWNLGEENTQSAEEQRQMAQYIRDTDPYKNHVVVHTFPDWQDKVYAELVGEKSVLTGASLQMNWNQVHQRTLQWRRLSAKTGRPWVVANDEQGSAAQGVPPDLGYQGFQGTDRQGKPVPTAEEIRKKTLWGNLMAGGAGVEYYFGYQLPENDLVMQDFRSRDKSYDYCRHALNFFRSHKIPFWRMESQDALVGNTAEANGNFAFVEAGKTYVVYLPAGGEAELDLSGVSGRFLVGWYSPRSGGPLQGGTVPFVMGGGKVKLGRASVDENEDWVVLVRAH